MATVNLLLRTKNNPANIVIRFTNGRAIDIMAPINVFVNPKHWDSKNQKIRNMIEVPNRDELNARFLALKTFVLNDFNQSFMLGEIIDRDWLLSSVNKFFKRPKQEKNKVNLSHHVYYIDFAEWWIDNKAKYWKTSNKKSLAETAIKQYKSFIVIFKKYEQYSKTRLKFKNITVEQINDFVTYMEDVEKYEMNTVSRHIGRFKFFCSRAESENIEVNKNYKERFFATETEDVLEPYLNESEIEKIFKKDFSFDTTLDNIRDNFIIGLWTGLRISDFNNNLDITNINDDYIEIKTEKTNTWVSIPVHPHVKAILKKRFGLLPEKFSDQKFNLHVKTICQICEIDEVIKGKLFDADTKRNKTGEYPKYKLVSSHICRRSFATNLFGVVPNSVIQNVGGWATEAMMLHYIKKSKRDHAEVLKKVWTDKYNNLK